MKKSEKLKRVQTAVEYTLSNPAALKALNRVGFPKAEVLTGKALAEQVHLLDAAQRKEYGEQYQATDELTQARREARALYIKHLETARFAFKEERGSWNALELSGARKDDLFGWLEQARNFYRNVVSVKDILAKYDLSEAELQQGESMIEAVHAAHNARQKEATEAQAATTQRNEAIEKLDAWMRRFTQSARLAFAKDPHTLKGLGLVSKVGV
jgi:hypothetical protein